MSVKRYTCATCGEFVEYETHMMMTFHSGTQPTVGGLVVNTNAPCRDEDFKVLFGFWNQRTKDHIYFCGACLGERLLLVCDPSVTVDAK